MLTNCPRCDVDIESNSGELHVGQIEVCECGQEFVVEVDHNGELALVPQGRAADFIEEMESER